MRFLIIILFLVIGIATNAQPPKKFYCRYGGNGYDEGNDVKQTLDGGYIITGSTSSIGQGNTDMYLLKLDSMGQVKFQKTFGGVSNEIGKSIVQLADSSYVMAGYTSSSGVGGYDVFLVKADKTGNLIWQKTYGGSDWDFANSMDATADGGFIIAGTTYSYGKGNADGFVIKTDANGDTTWTKTFGGLKDDEFKSVIQTSDGKYALTGYTKSFNDSLGDVWAIKLDINGDTLWRKFYGGVKEDFIRNNPFIPLYKLRRELEIIQKISKVTLSKYVNKLGFSRKRAKKRGRCKNNALEMLTKNFIDKFDQSKTANTKFVCIDECGFSENLRPLYGYSKKGEPLTIHTSGGWTHYSLLMAVFQCGKLNFSIKKGSINKSNFQTFINRLQIDDSYSIVMDNASIHKKLTLDCNPNIIYTPPYSPQFQPIELCFANIKRRFRNKFVENNVSEAIKESVFELSPEIIKSCFSHAFEKEIPLARTMTKI